MRHSKAERWITAESGGSLSPSRTRKLEAHLAACPGCRASRRRWEEIRAGAPVEIPPDTDAFWENSLTRLRTALEKPAEVPAIHPTPTRRVSGFYPWRTWAWGGGGALAAAAAVLLFILFSPPRPLGDAYAYSLGNPGVILDEGLAADETILAEFNESLQTDLVAYADSVPEDVVFLTADQILSLEDLTDEDVRAFLSEIALETGVEED